MKQQNLPKTLYILKWNLRFDICFLSQVSSGDLSGHVLVKSPSPWDSDDRGMFCLYLFPGTTKHKQVCSYNFGISLNNDDIINALHVICRFSDEGLCL